MANIVEKTMPRVEAMDPGAILDRVDDVEKLDKVARRTFGISELRKIAKCRNWLGRSPRGMASFLRRSSKADATLGLNHIHLLRQAWYEIARRVLGKRDQESPD